MLVNTVLSHTNTPELPPLVANNYRQLRSRWRDYATEAHTLHKNGKIKHAAALFTHCISIASKLLYSQSSSKEEQSGIELLYFSSHNLAACQNLLHEGSRAEHTLRHVYQTIVELCEAPTIPYETKWDALTVLDKSLFSLTSQLAYLGKVEQIHSLIHATDIFAEKSLTILEKKRSSQLAFEGYLRR